MSLGTELSQMTHQPTVQSIRVCHRHSVYIGRRNLKNCKANRAIAKSSRNNENDSAYFDGEDDWNSSSRQLGRTPESRLTGTLVNQALGSVGIVVDNITNIAIKYVPESTSYEVVRVAVVGGLLLVVLSFVKGVLSFVLTVGTLLFGAYIWVKVYGMDTNSISNNGPSGRSRARTGTPGKPEKKNTGSSLGLLNTVFLRIGTSFDSEDSGLLDVKMNRKPRKK
jgi:hypothetical protein